VLTIIPAYNERASIGDVVAGAGAHLPVLVVDDGSDDDTGARAKGAGADVLRQTPNRGKGAALRAGFQRALREGYEAVLTLDADGQHDPAEIPTFLNAHASQGIDLVIGQRDFRQMPPIRRLANSLGQKAFSWAVGRPIHDNQSGYRLISRRLVKRLLIGREEGFEFEMEMILECVRSDFSLGWVPIRTIYAGERSHIDPFRHLMNFTRFVWRARKAVRSSA
jgi:glycosyltransferase involved in cell wall biosynthesis